VLEAIRTEPGVRATILALEFDAPTEVILGHLKALERSGAIRKSGLGWACEACPAD
jgi:hypothetical protein